VPVDDSSLPVLPRDQYGAAATRGVIGLFRPPTLWWTLGVLALIVVVGTTAPNAPVTVIFCAIGGVLYVRAYRQELRRWQQQERAMRHTRLDPFG
jgi:hypothetical protein